MGIVVSMKGFSFFGKIWHKLFRCPSFWRPSKWYKCPKCGKTLKCYWDGNDVTGHGIDYCNKCAKELEENNYDKNKDK